MNCFWLLLQSHQCIFQFCPLAFCLHKSAVFITNHIRAVNIALKALQMGDELKLDVITGGKSPVTWWYDLVDFQYVNIGGVKLKGRDRGGQDQGVENDGRCTWQNPLCLVAFSDDNLCLCSPLEQTDSRVQADRPQGRGAREGRPAVIHHIRPENPSVLRGPIGPHHHLQHRGLRQSHYPVLRAWVTF